MPARTRNRTPWGRRPRRQPARWDFPGRPRCVLADGGPALHSARISIDGITYRVITPLHGRYILAPVETPDMHIQVDHEGMDELGRDGRPDPRPERHVPQTRSGSATRRAR